MVPSKRGWNIGMLLLALPLAWACAPEPDVSLRKVGCIAPLTGPDANYGKSTRQGLELAVTEINADLEKSGEPYRYELICEDDQMNPREGPTAFQKLLTVDQVPLIMGPFGSKVVLAVAPLAEEEETVLISASATSDQIIQAGDFTFRTVPTNKQQAEDCSAFALNTLGARTASLLYVNDTYGLTLATAFREAFEQAGGRVISEEKYDAGETDFRTQLTRLKQSSPELLFVPGYYKEPAQLLKQATDLRLKDSGMEFLGTDGSCTDELLAIAGASAEGVYFSNLAADFGNPDSAMREFIDTYTQRFGHEPDAYATYYYDSFKMVGTVLRSVEWDPKNRVATARRIRDALYQMKPFEGLTGTTQFDKNGEVSKSFAILVVSEGEFQQVSKDRAQ